MARTCHSNFAESVATFAIVMGFALVITGGGLVLAFRVLPRVREEDATQSAAVSAAPGKVALTS